MSRSRTTVRTVSSLPCHLALLVLLSLAARSTGSWLVTAAFAPNLPIVPVSRVVSRHHDPSPVPSLISWNNLPRSYPQLATTVLLASSGGGDSNEENEETTLTIPKELSESDQGILGVVGTLASLIVFYSEFTLKTTGCGLPAGPFGLWGLAEGVSYLGVTGLVAYSLFVKIQTGNGLPAGPGGLLGAAEGLSYLAIVVGLVVLALQITNYGYIPNAIPMEGGMCS